MTGGSQNLRIYRIARRDGVSLEDAAARAGMSVGEARLTDTEDAKNPPPAEAYQLLAVTPPPTDEGNDEMARPKKQEQVEEVIAPDFGLAVRLYRNDIKPAAAKGAEFAQKQSEAYKAIEKQAHVNRAAAKLAFNLDKMEESKRDDYLRSLRGLMLALNIYMPTDLVDAAEGKGEAHEEVIPTGQRRRPKLATIQGGKGNDTPPSDDSDLADGDATASVVDTAKASAAEPWADGNVKGIATAPAAAEEGEDRFGIVNERTGEWLGSDGEGEDVWLATSGEAATFTFNDATHLIGEFETADTLVARRLVGVE